MTEIVVKWVLSGTFWDIEWHSGAQFQAHGLAMCSYTFLTIC